ncbi:MAG: SLBB domain-containing protein [Acidobacteria bacterium]|nr:SLBB domain-containing protein [Acidobacteriota bacterium]
MKRFYTLAIVLFALSASTVLSQDTPSQDSVSGEIRNYMVVPGDKIEGKVMGEDQFSFLAYVDENGNFTVPFDEEPIAAKCRTEMDLRAEVTKRVAKYVRNPMVSVYVSARRKPQPVTVSGEVRNPGGVELRREARLLELIAFSGGVNEDAGGTVRLIRPQPPTCADPEDQAEWLKESENGTEIPSRMYSLSGIRSGVNESNPVVLPGDIIVVEKASPVYINGEITNPNGVYIKEGGLSLTQALAMAGGVRAKAKIKDVKIYRKRADSPERDVISANLELIKEKKEKDPMLEPYDIVDIGTKKKSVGAILLEAVLGGARSGALSLATGGANRVLY